MSLRGRDVREYGARYRVHFRQMMSRQRCVTNNRPVPDGNKVSYRGKDISPDVSISWPVLQAPPAPVVFSRCRFLWQLFHSQLAALRGLGGKTEPQIT